MASLHWKMWYFCFLICKNSLPFFAIESHLKGLLQWCWHDNRTTNLLFYWSTGWTGASTSELHTTQVAETGSVPFSCCWDGRRAVYEQINFKLPLSALFLSCKEVRCTNCSKSQMSIEVAPRCSQSHELIPKLWHYPLVGHYYCWLIIISGTFKWQKVEAIYGHWLKWSTLSF